MGWDHDQISKMALIFVTLLIYPNNHLIAI